MLISLHDNANRTYPKYFKVESVWVLEETYYDMITSCWNSNSKLINNLKNIKSQVNNWNMHCEKCLEGKNTIIVKLKGIQRAIQKGRNPDMLVKLEKKLQQDLTKILHQEEYMWYQRSKINV